VAHPDVLLVGCDVPEQGRRRREARQPGPSVLPAQSAADGAAELLRDQLRAVADPEHRHTEVVDRGVESRRALDVDALRPSGEDDRGRLFGGHLRCRDPVRDDLGVHVELADAPRDQLRVLRSEVDDVDRPAAHCRGRSRAGNR
jgi:hypothetical protein